MTSTCARQAAMNALGITGMTSSSHGGSSCASSVSRNVASSTLTGCVNPAMTTAGLTSCGCTDNSTSVSRDSISVYNRTTAAIQVEIYSATGTLVNLVGMSPGEHLAAIALNSGNRLRVRSTSATQSPLVTVVSGQCLQVSASNGAFVLLGCGSASGGNLTGTAAAATTVTPPFATSALYSRGVMASNVTSTPLDVVLSHTGSPNNQVGSATGLLGIVEPTATAQQTYSSSSSASPTTVTYVDNNGYAQYSYQQQPQQQSYVTYVPQQSYLSTQYAYSGAAQQQQQQPSTLTTQTYTVAPTNATATTSYSTTIPQNVTTSSVAPSTVTSVSYPVSTYTTNNVATPSTVTLPQSSTATTSVATPMVSNGVTYSTSTVPTQTLTNQNGTTATTTQLLGSTQSTPTHVCTNTQHADGSFESYCQPISSVTPRYQPSPSMITNNIGMAPFGAIMPSDIQGACSSRNAGCLPCAPGTLPTVIGNAYVNGQPRVLYVCPSNS